MVTLRGYRKFDFFRIQFMEAIEKSANATFNYNMMSRWLSFRMDVVCVAFGVFTTILCIFLRERFDRELLTFSLQLVTDVVVFFSISVRVFAEL